MSNAIVTTTNMELTPMRVTFNGVDLGGTLSNVVISAKYSKAEIKADQSGTTVRDRRVSGLEISLTTELNEIKNKDIWKVVFPHAVEVTTGGQKYIDFKTNMGDGDLANSEILILHPLSIDDSDKNTDFTFYKATANAESSVTYGPTEQGKLKIVWNILPDESTVPNRFFRYGDTALVGTAASFSAAVAGGGNVGNGTVTGIAVNNANTKTETVTLTNVGVIANAGNFSVTGSVSGPLGIAVVGVPFTVLPIALTINDGAIDFALGDSFTIATVAAE